ncbi:MAG TPA: CBS domain-containing protein [Candidatus Thermoplasmatota archaeon]|nr:CBS domain-containing protein [Candidatus Thermoplasmatota archaeon]
MRVEELMTKDPIVAEVPGHRNDVLKLLVQHSVSGVPVVKSKTRKLMGVVTRSDIFRRPDEEQIALLMTQGPVTISPKDEVSKAARIFHEKRIHGLPVVVADELVGVLSPSDVLKVIAESSTKRPVEEFVTEKACPVWTDTPLRVVWEIMRVARQNAVPILDDKGALVGIVADSDLFKKSQVEDLVKKGKLGLDEENWDGFRTVMPLYLANSKIEIPSAPVKDVMVRDIQTVFLRTSVSEAAKKMRRYKINQLPIVDTEDRLVGIITDLDLMRAEA